MKMMTLLRHMGIGLGLYGLLSTSIYAKDSIILSMNQDAAAIYEVMSVQVQEDGVFGIKLKVIREGFGCEIFPESFGTQLTHVCLVQPIGATEPDPVENATSIVIAGSVAKGIYAILAVPEVVVENRIGYKKREKTVGNAVCSYASTTSNPPGSKYECTFARRAP